VKVTFPLFKLKQKHKQKTKHKMAKFIGEVSKREQHLYKTFEAVKNPIHWKEPIDAKIPLDELSKQEITVDDIKEAIEYYTASIPETEIEGKFLKVRAKGYRLGPMGGM
jgi:hypothetical protein